ncbi:MAG: carbohydrate ABC transporter permease [Candidatus Methanomethylicaceae archaeon]
MTLVIWILILLFMLILLLPMFFIALTSFKKYGEIVAGIMFPTTITFENYINVLYAPGFKFADFIINSILITIFSTLISTAVSFPAAYSMARFKTGGGTLSSYILSLRLLPPIIFALPIYILYHSFNLIDTHIGLILIYTVFNIPLSILVLRSFISDLPIELEEAALIDGCSRLKIITNIVFPLTMPGIVATSILNFLACWNEYLFALIITFKKAATVNVAASLFVTAYAIKYGEIAASVMIAMLSPIVFMFLVQRNLVRGLTLGAVKK